ncbi:hypothetical protein A3A64_03885 [Candidatus Gottesmanbacteria bacterium RIFCSPLOWO2_01_FULL_48_11]|uniref:Uncharacterized protein n=1 Tax=Candidatus Gottesmanbacteria bacterium RIFCSPLOWO2_01_FULL_48_11 TaxID=1798395 RepID=A0A1F6AT74_9BACT|nr:MAG: hypothetical protein A3A64_03885 [Candidatus Gottesmanbacteria bacterium RIFCSPLOWO2_01_FULL_48_11]
MSLTVRQLDILSRICTDVAKGLFLASLAAPTVTSMVTLMMSMRIFVFALVLTVIALGIVETKGVNT